LVKRFAYESVGFTAVEAEEAAVFKAKLLRKPANILSTFVPSSRDTSVHLTYSTAFVSLADSYTSGVLTKFALDLTFEMLQVF